MRELIISGIWTVIAVVGLTYSVRNRRVAAADARWVEASKRKGARLLLADGNLRRETTRLVFWTVFLAVGVAALVFPRQVRCVAVLPDQVGLMLVVALLLGMVLNAYNSRADYEDGRKVREGD